LNWSVPAGVFQPPAVASVGVVGFTGSQPYSAASTVNGMIETPGANGGFSFMPTMPFGNDADETTKFGPGASLFYADKRFGE
jgi:hypothetical protein